MQLYEKRKNELAGIKLWDGSRLVCTSAQRT